MWVGETIADVVNYPLAGLFVLFLGSSAALAFWFDAVTYLASAVLLATMVVPPIVRRARSAVPGAGAATIAEPEPTTGGVPTVADVRRDLQRGLGLPAHRGGPAREHGPEHGRHSSRSAS